MQFIWYYNLQGKYMKEQESISKKSKKLILAHFYGLMLALLIYVCYQYINEKLIHEETMLSASLLFRIIRLFFIDIWYACKLFFTFPPYLILPLFYVLALYKLYNANTSFIVDNRTFLFTLLFSFFYIFTHSFFYFAASLY